MKNLLFILSFSLLLIGCGSDSEDASNTPEEIRSNTNLDSAIAIAQVSNRPLFVFFTGWNCVSSRKMENEVFASEEVFTKLKDDFVVVTLYVDDKDALPESEQTIWDFNGNQRPIVTVGNKNTRYQIEKFQVMTQPYIAILAPNGEAIINTYSDFRDTDKVDAFLEKSLTEFKNMEPTTKELVVPTTGQTVDHAAHVPTQKLLKMIQDGDRKGIENLIDFPLDAMAGYAFDEASEMISDSLTTSKFQQGYQRFFSPLMLDSLSKGAIHLTKRKEHMYTLMIHTLRPPTEAEDWSIECTHTIWYNTKNEQLKIVGFNLLCGGVL